MGQFDKLLEPLKIKNVTIRNRIVSTPHAEVYADNYVPNERYILYHAEKARGGVGMTMFGGSSSVSIDNPVTWWKSLDFSNDRIIEPLQKMSDAVHGHGAALMVQLTHMGRRSRWDGGNWPHLPSPSGLREPVHRATCKIIEIEDIDRIVKDFGKAALRAKQGGLDGIEISADHQQLVDQFWSPRVNKRTDGYGGSFENRMRFGLEVLEEVRKQVGDDFVVGLRMCGDEFHPDGITQDEAIRIAKFYTETGMVDLLSVTGSGADTHATLANCMPNMAYPPEPFLYLASGIKAEVNVPVIHAQNIKDPMSAARIIEEGHVDLVGITRGHIADPHFVNKMKEGRLDEIKQCVGANYCIDRQYQGIDVLCVQNAATSREKVMPHVFKKSDKKKKVVVVGGGPAGMEAARVCAERGHDVTLFEKQGTLGGQITLAAKAPARDQIAGISRWFMLELKRLKVDTRLNTEANADAIRDLKPDIVIIATGGHPFLEQEPNWHADEGLVVSTHDILSGRVEPAKNVLVMDVTSVFPGATCADYIANRGSLVEIVTPDLHVGEGMGGTTLPVYNKRFSEKDVVLTPNMLLHDVYREGDKLIAVLENEYIGTQEERVVDQIVVENGVRPNEDLYNELKEQSRNKGQVDLEKLYAFQPQPEVPGEGFLLYRVGDCISPRDIHGAIYDSLRLCKDF